MKQSGYGIWFGGSMTAVLCVSLCMLPLGHELAAVTPDITSTSKTWRRRKQEWF